jgi:hypothetical protein
VQLAEEELTALQPPDDKTLLLERFFEPDQLDLILLSGRSLYLAPSLPAARQPFALLLAALRSTEKWALGRVVLSNNRQVVIVRPDQETLVMHVLCRTAHADSAGQLSHEDSPQWRPIGFVSAALVLVRLQARRLQTLPPVNPSSSEAVSPPQGFLSAPVGGRGHGYESKWCG